MTSTKRQIVEAALSSKCGPLTMVQCTADWFALRRFHFTGTLGANTNFSSIDSDDSKLRLLDKCIDSWFGRHRSTEYIQQGLSNEVL